LAQACDFRLGDSTCAFSIPAAKLGIVYSVEECRALADAVGHARAKQILLSGATFNGVHASRIGLIDLVQDGEVLREAQALGAAVANNSSAAVAGMKFILNCLGDGDERERREEIAALIGRATESREYRQVIAGFRSKRKAKSDTR
jgi:enoyl-CoA hydratase/carnithine racemase